MRAIIDLAVIIARADAWNRQNLPVRAASIVHRLETVA
jgi:hypothetical protein